MKYLEFWFIFIIIYQLISVEINGTSAFNSVVASQKSKLGVLLQHKKQTPQTNHSDIDTARIFATPVTCPVGQRLQGNRCRKIVS